MGDEKMARTIENSQPACTSMEELWQMDRSNSFSNGICGIEVMNAQRMLTWYNYSDRDLAVIGGRPEDRPRFKKSYYSHIDGILSCTKLILDLNIAKL
jgi:hypothetical protein